MDGLISLQNLSSQFRVMVANGIRWKCHRDACHALDCWHSSLSGGTCRCQYSDPCLVGAEGDEEVREERSSSLILETCGRTSMYVAKKKSTVYQHNLILAHKTRAVVKTGTCKIVLKHVLAQWQ